MSNLGPGTKNKLLVTLDIMTGQKMPTVGNGACSSIVFDGFISDHLLFPSY